MKHRIFNVKGQCDFCLDRHFRILTYWSQILPNPRHMPDKISQKLLWYKGAFTALTTAGLIYTSGSFDPALEISKFIKKSFKCIQNTFLRSGCYFYQELLILYKYDKSFLITVPNKDYLKKITLWNFKNLNIWESHNLVAVVVVVVFKLAPSLCKMLYLWDNWLFPVIKPAIKKLLSSLK